MLGKGTLRLVKSIAVAALVLAGCSAREARLDDDPLIDANSSRAHYAPPPAEMSSVPAAELAAAFYPFDSAVLTSSAKKVLRDDAAWLSAHPDAAIEIIGYCDARGSDDYNYTLGEKRAAAAKSYLKKLGIAESRITTVSFGRVDGDPSQWDRNRRASFTLFYPGSAAR